MPGRRFSRAVVLVCLGYFLFLAALAGRLSLWLDEVLELIGTRGHTIPEILRYVVRNPGAMPLGYLVQAAFVNSFGYSVLTARLPSILCSTLAAAVVWKLGRKTVPFGAAELAFGGFLLLPLQFRYGLEARPYSLALLLSVLSTLLMVQIEKEWSRTKAAAYCGVVLLGIYTQPFSILIAGSHLLWTTFFAKSEKRTRSLAWAATVGSGLLFLPWFLYAKAAWKARIVRMDLAAPNVAHWGARAPLMILPEISGAGYWGGAALAIAACAGLACAAMDRRWRMLLGLTMAVPIAGTLAADFFFGYFLAIRQVIFVLPGLVILAAAGIYCLYESRRTAGGRGRTGKPLRKR